MDDNIDENETDNINRYYQHRSDIGKVTVPCLCKITSEFRYLR